MSTQTQVKASVVLDTAADLLEQRGWAQVQWNNASENKPMCIEGAIAAALGMTDVEIGTAGDTEVYDQLTSCPAYKAVRKYVDNDGAYLFTWNDRPRRTKEEVIETLRTVAELERTKENQ